MRAWKPSSVVATLVVLGIVLAPSATAQTSEWVEGAPAGTSAGTLAVFLEFIVDHDTSFFAEDATYQAMPSPETLHGREAIAEFFAVMYGGAFTETHVEWRTVLADGNHAVLEFVFNGTNTGEFFGMEPTGQRVSVPILGIFEIDGESIRSGRIYYDSATMMRQLGVID